MKPGRCAGRAERERIADKLAVIARGFRVLNDHHTEHHEREGTELLLDADVADASCALKVLRA